MFQDSEFEAAAKELEYPQIEGWEYYIETHGVTIYRLYNEKSGLYQYKVYGTLDDVLPEVCAEVYMDTEYRKQWDSYAGEIEEREVENGKKVVYWNVNYPFLMSDRDYVYIREKREFEINGKKVWVVLSRSELSTQIPERDGIIRVDDFLQSCVLTSDGKAGSKAFMQYYDNPKGMIPTWLINWGAKTGVPEFLTRMQIACRGYPEYLAMQKTS